MLVRWALAIGYNSFNFSDLPVLLNVIQFIKKVVELAQASLAFDHMFQAVDFSLHQLSILVGLSQSLF